MLPTLQPGDEVVVDLEVRTVRCGDLITVRNGEALIVHRVIEGGPPLVTRGDNSPRADEPIEVSRLLGRVVEIRREGRCIGRDRVCRRLANGLLGRLARLSLRHGSLEGCFRVALRWCS